MVNCDELIGRRGVVYPDVVITGFDCNSIESRFCEMLNKYQTY
jgi:hypothetical protein